MEEGKRKERIKNEERRGQEKQGDDGCRCMPAACDLGPILNLTASSLPHSPHLTPYRSRPLALSVPGWVRSMQNPGCLVYHTRFSLAG